MALERQSIEKKDFPIGRRGYDPEAVDAHLSALAHEVEELKASSRRRTETVASAASDRVRAIVDAAEKSAAEIQRQAEADAQGTRAEAAAEAQATRERATGQAREYVGKVSESTNVMLQRIDAIESELGALMESMRTGANRLTTDLQLLETNLGDVREASGPRPRFQPEAAPGEPPVDSNLPEEAEPVAEEDATEPVTAPAPAAGGSDDTEGARLIDVTAPAPAAGGLDDTEGARLIALNMALNGTPRDETDRYLAENFTVSDRGRLLDDVYASVES